MIVAVGIDSELDLAARLRAGDETAFETVVRRHHHGLLRFARTLCRSRSVAEEIVQETWLAVVRSIASFEGRSSLSTWIYGILLNQARRRAARDARRWPLATIAQDGEAGGEDPSRFRDDGSTFPGHWREYPRDWDVLPEHALLGRETLAVVEDAIESLPEAQRLVITLRDVEGWTGPEVSETLGITQGNQRVLLHRARVAVRQALERHFDA